MKIQGFSVPPNPTLEGQNVKQEVKNGFLDLLTEAIKKVDELQTEATQKVNQHLVGQGVELHDAVIAVQKADLSLQVLNQIKNKIIKAYEELTRIQV
ncbi:MAG: flagellar hook-basal body complex protein FliE [Deltaproteobacteria bacterium]|nr:flagellar hook-basal body complex protein FliE [Deltaproteobacteria bacterium]